MKIKDNLIKLLLILFSLNHIQAQTLPEKKEFSKNLEIYQKKDYKRAYQEFKKFNEKYPAGYYRKEVSLYIASLETNYYSAIILYKDLIEKYPESKITDEAIFRLAKLYYLHDNHTETIRTFQSLLDNYQKSGYIYETYYYLGTVYLIKNDFEKAAVYFDYIINRQKKDKFFILSIIGKANCFYEQKDYGKSAYYYKEALKINEKNYFPAIYFGLGNCYFKQKKYDNAYEYYRKVVKEYPGSSEYEPAMEKLNHIKDNKTIFDSIDWNKFKASEKPPEKKPEMAFYSVQVASVKNPRYVNNWRIKLKTVGYDSFTDKVTIGKQTYYRTMAGKYQNKEEAGKLKKDIELKFKLQCAVVEIK